ncbi:MAG: alginate export family protein [Chlorobi bacterium]|nr:alginate export family protein [Chlorobiota bacterium]
MNRFSIIGLIVLIGFTIDLSGQDKSKFDISGQIRHRFEMSDRSFGAETEPINFNLLRSRLNVVLTPLRDVEAFFQIQDSRRFGEETSTLKDGSADNLDMHQVYFNIKELFNLPVNVKVGRMEIAFANERIVGPVGWDNIGRSFDGIIVNVHSRNVSADFFNLKQVDKMAPGDTGDINGIGTNVDIKLADNYKTQALIFWQKAVPSSVLSRVTLGFYAKGTHGGFQHETEFYYQTGTITSIREQDVQAYMAALNVWYTFAELGVKPAISLGMEYLSGDDNVADDKYKVFNTLYATNHKFYGYMDYFLNIPVHTYGLGLVDMNAKVSFKPMNKLKAKAIFHIFNASENYTLNDGSTANDFGSELDVVLNYQYNKRFSFVGGLSLFTPGSIFKETKGEDSSLWFFLMSTVNL